MSILGSYQTEPQSKNQAKTSFYNFMTNKPVPSTVGRPSNNPFSKTKDGQVIVRFMSAKQKEDTTSDSMYLSSENEKLLEGWGAKINSEAYSKVAKSRYKSLVDELSRAKHPDDQKRSVEKLIKLINIVEKYQTLPDPELGTQITKSLIKYEKRRSEARQQGVGKMGGGMTKMDAEYVTPAQSREVSVAPERKLLAPQGRKPLVKDWKSDTSLTPGISPYPTQYNPVPADFDVPSGMVREMSDRVVKLADRTADLIQKSKSRSNPPSRAGSSERDISGKSEPSVDWEDERPAGGGLKAEVLKQSAKDLLNKQKQAPNVSYAGGGQQEQKPPDVSYAGGGQQDPTNNTKYMDMRGAVLEIFDETIGKTTKQPRQPNAKNLDSDVPQDQQNQLAIDNESYRGANPYRITAKEMLEAEERERHAYETASKFYSDEYKMLSENNNILDGGGSDVTGVGRGSQRDLDLLGSDFAPASWDVGNPRGMAQSMNKNRNRSVSQARDGSIGVEINGYDNNVRRTARNAGLSDEGLTPEQILNREMNRDYLGQEGRRLGDRVGQAIMDNANSLMSAGSGIAGQIGDLLDQNFDGFGQDSRGAGLFGAEGGIYNNNDVSQPRTLNERFSTMGMRRQGDKIDKYINMKNKGMMYSNLMGKGVSDPSIQSIRDRKDDYIQPNGKHKGDSVNLIRQSNATSIRLNNMYMP